MSDIIRLLPDSVANQIAAGEVIQRPASVIKELVENAVDAGATDIKIFIKDAGRTLIQVVDNGKGMSETDARMAFERHATSKIKAADDLFSLHTMGFRGEALPSICAISQVEIKTRMEDDQFGTRLLINASRVETQEPVVCDRGTNIMVKNLFFNVPARRKFLKTDNVETSNIVREFERLALVNNHIKISLDTGGKVYDLRAATFKQRIGDIWKNSLDLHLLPIDVDTSLVKINGFISRPEYARRRNPLQYLIVNGRNMRHPYFHKAIMNCYESLIAPDTQPCYFIKFEVDPASIDVNIHPTKNEIKFEYEQEIWPILQASVKAALGKFGAVPSIDFNSDVLPVEPLQKGEVPECPSLDIPSDYNPFEEQKRNNGAFPFSGDTENAPKSFQGGYNPKNDRPISNWDKLYAEFMSGSRGFSPKNDEAESKPQNDKITQREILQSDNVAGGPEGGLFPNLDPQAGVATICMQHGLKYIITSTPHGVMVIDQHRAHVKILYEKYINKILKGEQVSQRVMFPDKLSLDPVHQVAFEEISKDLQRLGFVLEYEEENAWKITSVPAMLKNADPRDVILKILDSVTEGGTNYGKDGDVSEELFRNMALLLARAAAIEGGKKLTPDEMEHIIGELFSLPDPAYTPNGNPVYYLVDDRLLDNFFKG